MRREVVFVFGSNRKGIHGAGAALRARQEHGAEPGVGEGRTGDAYAIPTCYAPGDPLRIDQVKAHVDNFLHHAYAHPDTDFLLTAVGCGLAGFTPLQIARLFRQCPDNVYMQGKLARGCFDHGVLVARSTTSTKP